MCSLNIGDVISIEYIYMKSNIDNKFDGKFVIIKKEKKSDKLDLYPYKLFTLCNIKTRNKIDVKIWKLHQFNTYKLIKHRRSWFLYFISKI